MLDLARSLPPWYRRRALADLERLIAQLEGRTSSPSSTPKRRAAAAQSMGRSGGVPEDCLVLLHRSRQVLLAAQGSPARVSQIDTGRPL